MKGVVEQRRLKADVWGERVARFADSGLTVRAFCAQEGISIWSFNRWRSRLAGVDAALPSAKRNGATPAGSFVELGTLNGPRSPSERFELRLDLGGGVTLHLVRG
jgi:putative transposase